jgi:hypothetical protein
MQIMPRTGIAIRTKVTGSTSDKFTDVASTDPVEIKQNTVENTAEQTNRHAIAI